MSSRKESIEDFLRDKVAKKGRFSAMTPFKIYLREIKKLSKQDLCPMSNTKSNVSVYVKLSWENPKWDDPLGEGPPIQVLDYVEGITDIFPETSIKTLAQELYVIATRANYEKSKK